jgi:hypothetical protein
MNGFKHAKLANFHQPAAASRHFFPKPQQCSALSCGPRLRLGKNGLSTCGMAALFVDVGKMM